MKSTVASIGSPIPAAIEVMTSQKEKKNMKTGKNLNTHFAAGIITDINNLAEEIIKEFKDNYNGPEIDLVDFLPNAACDMARDLVVEHFADIYSLEKDSKVYTDLIKLTLVKVSTALIFDHGV